MGEKGRWEVCEQKPQVEGGFKEAARGRSRVEWVNGGWPTGSDTHGRFYLVLSVRVWANLPAMDPILSCFLVEGGWELGGHGIRGN
jgi:hypothetical protein